MEDDRDAYLAAALAPPEQALDRCGDIDDADLRGECVAFAALQIAEDDPAEALESCGAVAEWPWRDGCPFLVVAEADVDGPMGVRACAQAGSLEDPCVGALIDHELEEHTDLPLAIGRERALRRAIREVVETYAGGRPVVVNAQVRFHVAELVAHRWRDQPFDPELCGALGSAVCGEAYADSIHARADDLDLDTACLGDIDLAAVTEAGGPPWTEAGEELALSTWRRLCDRYLRTR